jgi:hypothetical protein
MKVSSKHGTQRLRRLSESNTKKGERLREEGGRRKKEEGRMKAEGQRSGGAEGEVLSFGF